MLDQSEVATVGAEVTDYVRRLEPVSGVRVSQAAEACA
jgi:hypothetical protein